jgi:trans-2,3-dihydro-3-hydroxyanthranilate isomerase
MHKHPNYILLDVFSERPFAGNQLAVFIQAGVDDSTMQRIARELNLSETVFVERAADAAASLRIFTPYHEMRFAGHPTIGAAIALATEPGWVAPGTGAFVLRLPVGNVPIVLERERSLMAWLTTPPVRFGAEFDVEDLAAMCGLAAQNIDSSHPNGLAGADTPFLYVPVRSEIDVDRASAVASELKARAGWDGINGLYVYAMSGINAYSRMFAPMSGIVEDPATGSAAGPLAALLERAGLLPAERFVIRQGVAMGRESELHVRAAREAGGVPAFQVGGSAVRVGSGTLLLDA